MRGVEDIEIYKGFRLWKNPKLGEWVAFRKLGMGWFKGKSRSSVIRQIDQLEEILR